MATAQVGPENPLPPLVTVADIHASIDTAAADAEMRRNIGYGRVSTVLPYLVQDGYGRSRGRPSTRSRCWRTTSWRHLPAGPRWPAVVPRAQAHRERAAAPEPGPPAANLACATRGSPVAWSGTSGPSGTPPPPASRCTLPASFSRTARRLCGCTSSKGCAKSSSRSTPGCPRTPRCCWCTYGSSIPATSKTAHWWSNVAVPQPDDVRVLAPADAAWRSPPTGASVGPDPHFRRTGPHLPNARGGGRRLLLRRSTTTSVAGSLRWTAGAAHWCRRRPTCFAVGALRVGTERRRRTTGRSGSPGRARSTSRYRQDWPGPSSSTCRCRTCVLGLGRGVRTARERRRTPSTRPTGPGAPRRGSDLEALVPRAALDQVLADTRHGPTPSRTRY